MKALKWLFTVVIIGLFSFMPAAGQENAKEQVFVEVDQMPAYPGGIEKLKQYIAEQVSYPEDAKNNGIQGKVFISFTIDKKGDVVDAEVVKKVHFALDTEALRVVESMPSWTPGIKDGQAVKVRFTIPVEFKLDPEKKG